MRKNSSSTDKLKIFAEDLAYWYLRLNGFLTIPNFVVHPDFGRSQRTEVDVLAVRFPHRSELFINPMVDDTKAVISKDEVLIYLAEAKRGSCDLNGPWTSPENKNMERVIRAVGAFPLENVDEIAEALYCEGYYQNGKVRMSLMCIGELMSTKIKRKFPKVPQITWDQILRFIYDRFNKYPDQKCSHQQWPGMGKRLYRYAISSQSGDEFKDKVEIKQT